MRCVSEDVYEVCDHMLHNDYQLLTFPFGSTCPQ